MDRYPSASLNLLLITVLTVGHDDDYVIITDGEDYEDYVMRLTSTVCLVVSSCRAVRTRARTTAAAAAARYITGTDDDVGPASRWASVAPATSSARTPTPSVCPAANSRATPLSTWALAVAARCPTRRSATEN